jgi:DNA polymerase III subunit alpha
MADNYQQLEKMKELNKQYEAQKNKLKTIAIRMFQCTMEIKIREKINKHKDLIPHYIVFDTETTGLPRDRSNPPVEKNLHMYDTARILQLSWAVYDINGKLIKLENYLIKPCGYLVSATEIHGITEEIAQTGQLFKVVINKFYEDVKKVAAIIAHNINFDDNVLKSEMIRHDLFIMLNEYDKVNKVCSMKKCKYIVKALGKNGQVKNPKQLELYKFVMGEEMMGDHDAKYDVLNLGRVITKLIKQKKFKF